MVELDGSVGEGGGQILRSALALSVCTGQPVRIRHIRARRPKPGLMRQHLACVNAAIAISGASAVGAELNSQELVFEPGAAKSGDYAINVGSAGSCTLVLQTILPPLMQARDASRVVLTGGTHNPMAPPFHFIDRCFVPLLRRIGVNVELSLRRLGFYPAGGGEFAALIEPASGGLMPVDLTDRGPLRRAFAECIAPGVPADVARRELEVVARKLGWPTECLSTYPARQNEGPGNALMATLEYENLTEVVSGFGDRGRSAEAVAAGVCGEVLSYQRAQGALGPHLADQWMLPLALAVASSGVPADFTCTRLTEHSKTHIRVIESFLPVRVRAQQAEAWRCRISPIE